MIIFCFKIRYYQHAISEFCFFLRLAFFLVTFFSNLLVPRPPQRLLETRHFASTGTPKVLATMRYATFSERKQSGFFQTKMFVSSEKWFPGLIEHEKHPLVSWHILETLRFLSLGYSADFGVLSCLA